MKLDRVTFTGADDSVSPDDLVKLSEKYPFIEWGILFVLGAEGQMGRGSRFPSTTWIAELLKVSKDKPAMNFCAHLCGEWVRDIMIAGKYAFGHTPFANRFARVQLNFHGERQSYDSLVGLRNAKRQFLFQVDGINDGLVQMWCEKGLGFPLFDVSGGAGILPKKWPSHFGEYCGYAGGLGPKNTAEQVAGPIAEAVGDGRIWIDMETRVRSKSDALFDLLKVEDVCEQVKPYVTT